MKTGDFSLRVKFSLVEKSAQSVTLAAQQSREHGTRFPKGHSDSESAVAAAPPRGGQQLQQPFRCAAVLCRRKTFRIQKGSLGRALGCELLKCKMSREGKPSMPFVIDRTTLKTLFTLEISVYLVFYCTNLIFPFRPPRLGHSRYWEGRS